MSSIPRKPFLGDVLVEDTFPKWSNMFPPEPAQALTRENFEKVYEEFKNRAAMPKQAEWAIILPPIIIDRRGAPKRPPGYSERPRGRNRQRAMRRWERRGIPAWIADRESRFYVIGETLLLTPKQDAMVRELGRESLDGLARRDWWDHVRDLPIYESINTADIADFAASPGPFDTQECDASAHRLMARFRPKRF